MGEIVRTNLVSFDEFVNRLNVVQEDDGSMSLVVLPAGATNSATINADSVFLGYKMNFGITAGDYTMVVVNSNVAETNEQKPLGLEVKDYWIRSVIYQFNATVPEDYIDIQLWEGSVKTKTLAQRVYNLGGGVAFALAGNRYWQLKENTAIKFTCYKSSGSENTYLRVILEVLV